jgi:hypothetical protein
MSRNRPPAHNRLSRPFAKVARVGLTLPDVTLRTRYDGLPVLTHGGCFLAGLASHPTAEPDTLVVRHDIDEREWLLLDAPEIYYVTDYYRKYPLILARLARLDREMLRELLTISWRLTHAKCAKRFRGRRYPPE